MVLDILKTIFSVPGAIIIVAILVFIAFMTHTRVFENLKLRLKRGQDKELELETKSTIGETPKEEGVLETSKEKQIDEVWDIEPKDEAEEDEKGYYKKALQAYMKKDIDGFTLNWDKIIEKSNEPDKSKKKVLKFYNRFQLGDTKAIKELEKLITGENEISKMAREYLAYIYDELENEDLAIDLINKNIKFTQKKEEKLEYSLYICNLEIKRKRYDEAHKVLENLIKDYAEPADISRINKKFGKLYKNLDKLETAFNYYERALEDNPADDSLRFNTAYKYSNAGQKEMALYHYKILDSHNYSPTSVKNNLGIAYHNLEMPILGTQFYYDAIKAGSTLASSNLANKLIKVGNINLAKKELDEALKKENVHENVNESIVSIKNNKTEEKNTEDKILELATVKRTFSLKIQNALSKQEKLNKEDILGTWQSSLGEIEISQVICIEGHFKYSFYEVILSEQEFNKFILKFQWKEKGTYTPKSDIGFIIFSDDGKKFDGLLLNFPEIHEFKTFSGTKS